MAVVMAVVMEVATVRAAARTCMSVSVCTVALVSVCAAAAFASE